MKTFLNNLKKMESVIRVKQIEGDKEICLFNSPLGPLEVTLLAGKLYSVSLAGNFLKSKKSAGLSQTQPLNSVSYKPSPQMKTLLAELYSYFNREPVSFSISLASRGSLFQQKVWSELQQIPFGERRAYSFIASRLKKPKGSRAVGGACAKNPFLIVVPCHRVIGKTGLGGFALGLKAKRFLLDLEKKHGV